MPGSTVKRGKGLGRRIQEKTQLGGKRVPASLKLQQKQVLKTDNSCSGGTSLSVLEQEGVMENSFLPIKGLAGGTAFIIWEALGLILSVT